MHVFRSIHIFYFPPGIFILAIRFDHRFSNLDILNLGSKILSIKDWPVTILFPGYITHKANRVIYIEHINAGIRITTDQGGEISRITEKHKRKYPQAEP